MMRQSHELYDLSGQELPLRYLNRPGGCVDLNWHEELELLYCVRGTGKAICGSKTMLMEPGHIYAMNPGEMHMFLDHGQLHYYCLILDNSFLSQNYLDLEPLQSDIVSPKANDLYQRIADTIESNEPYRVAQVRALALSLVVHLLQNFKSSTTKQSTQVTNRERIVKQAVSYIRENYSHKLNLQNIADHVGFSKYHFARLFKSATGMSVIAYLNQIRCKEAKKLLLQKKYSVSQVAALCGFESTTYFSSVYATIMGTPPSKEAARVDDD